MLQHMKTNHLQQNYLNICWCEKFDMINIDNKTAMILFEIRCMNQEMMKKHQCIKFCTKCELWHEITKFFSIIRDRKDFNNQPNLLTRLKKFFDIQNCQTICWNQCYNDKCKKCELWKKVHEKYKECQLKKSCKHHRRKEN